MSIKELLEILTTDVGGILALAIVAITFWEKIFVIFQKMHIQITRELYFKITDIGELFFPKVLIYAPLDVKILKMEFKINCLQKTIGQRQSSNYDCLNVEFGTVEKIQIGTFFSKSNYFKRRTPEIYLKKGDSEEILVHCKVISSKKIIDKIEDMKEQVTKCFSQNPNNPDNQKINNIINDASKNIAKDTCVVEGEHEITCKIKYKRRLFGVWIKGACKSKIKFSINKDKLEKYTNEKIHYYFLTDILSTNKNIIVRYPELVIDSN